AFEQLQSGAAAGRRPRHPAGEAELVQRPDRIGAADDGKRLGVRDGLGHRFRPFGEARPFEDPHRPLPEDRLPTPPPPPHPPTPGRSRPYGRASSGTTCVPASASNAAAATTSLGSSTGNPSGEPSRSSSAILPPTSTVSALPPRLRRTPSLSSTFAPPETRTN